ncbi:MAG TPA: cysteine--tRNA ligase [Candidatus Bilamarchaeum sp.]|nr:cysteine--tRNA ligase [Candidatus Bilamarchaeum sp.]
MKFYNSLTKRSDSISPPGEKLIMYVCGLTPYDSAHIGHARTYVAFDSLKRYLIKRGYGVYHIQNVTDVDDKIIKRCRETGADPKALTEQNHAEALELFAALHILPADVYPKVTGHIKEIIGLIQSLISAGSAYETASGVYFSVPSFPAYGLLSGQNMEEIQSGARVEVDEKKKNPADFALWKKTRGEIIEFDSPWGPGRPGWHIECSAMARAYAKRTLDIHGGARDLIFPHHENEIAQSEGASKEQFCRHWMHTGFLTVSGEKMSKSLGNFITLRQALSASTPNALRLFYLQAHYRSPLDYDEEAIEAAGESVERIFNSLGLIREEAAGPDHPDAEFRKKSDELIASFYSNLDDDFRTPEAIAALFSLLRLSNAHLGGKKDSRQLAKILAAAGEMLWILGLEEEKKGLGNLQPAISALARELGASEGASAEETLETIIDLREKARKEKDYKKSDLIRARLKELGITLEDKAGSGGARWKL